jgi:hypothetical protein
MIAQSWLMKCFLKSASKIRIMDAKPRAEFFQKTGFGNLEI